MSSESGTSSVWSSVLHWMKYGTEQSVYEIGHK